MTLEPENPDLLLPLHPPGVLLLHLLDQCNLSCQHCYLDARSSGTSLLPLDQVIDCLGEAEALGIQRVYLSGGEPLLYPELPTLLEVAARYEALDLYLSTNGTLIGPQEAERLRLAGAQAQVSIDGPPEYHDVFRGLEGAFARAARGVETLVAAGVPVKIVSTICRDNLALLPWLVRWAAEKGADCLSAQPLMELGRGAQIAGKRLDAQQLCALFFQLSDLGHAYRSQGLELKLAYRSRRHLLEHPCAAYVCDGSRCHRKVDKEIKTVVVRPDGTVLPEIPTIHPDYALGNLSEGPLRCLVARYWTDGYARFDRLCRTVYGEVMPTWASPIVPWDELVSARSWA